jgi:transposase
MGQADARRGPPPVSVPTVEDAAIRDLGRAREEASRDLKTATCRRQAFVLRHAMRSTGRAPWNPAPRRGRSDVVCPPPAQPLVLQAYVRAVNAPAARLQRLAQARHEAVPAWRWHPVVEARQALRGVPCTVAVTPVAALGDLTRVDHPTPLLDSWGLTPTASSCGPRRRQGASTTAGHTPTRRALGEGAWASRDPATVRRH